MQMGRVISEMYSRLVKGDDDILGHIAYSIYKKQKASRIKEICNKKKVDYVPEDDLRQFIELAQSDGQVSFYVERAEILVKDFMERSFGSELKKEKERLESEFADNHKSRGFLYGVVQSIVGSFLFLLIGYLALVTTGSWDRIVAMLKP